MTATVAGLDSADALLGALAGSLQEMIADEPEKVKAFLEAEILGWQDYLRDPEEGARLAVEEYGKDLDLDMAKEVEQAEVQSTLIVGGLVLLVLIAASVIAATSALRPAAAAISSMHSMSIRVESMSNAASP